MPGASPSNGRPRVNGEAKKVPDPFSFPSLDRAWAGSVGFRYGSDRSHRGAGLADRLRRLENTGRPLGDDGFLKKLSASLGRQLVP
ncbi:MAG TPA: hypothetical protein VM389_05650, partial [Phycisphaerae bacterium]|nr:hypothetical protein [Phycisphaerae bacterium]